MVPLLPLGFPGSLSFMPGLSLKAASSTSEASIVAVFSSLSFHSRMSSMGTP